MLFTRRDLRFRIGERIFGIEHSTVFIHDKPYLTRWILCVGLGTLRLHKFWRGDDDCASHTHPWWFITMPFSAYKERVFRNGKWIDTRTVKAFRFHFRPANFEHIVDGRAAYRDRRPFYTFVITGHRTNAWGFYPKPNHFIPWRDYK